MKFLEMDEQSAEKGYGILEAIISMARFMGMKIIAEGVETKEQMDYLLNMGCTYGQGYYFYHPMPISVFEPLLANKNNLDLRGIKARQLERLHIKELLNENIVSEAMLNNIMGGVAFYKIHDVRSNLCAVMNNILKLRVPMPLIWKNSAESSWKIFMKKIIRQSLIYSTALTAVF